jgi:RNA polymerase sigma-70 factor (ECF subfamily)
MVDVDTEGLAFQLATTAQPSPEQDLESQEFRSQLEAALLEIQEPHRSIIILREIQDMKYEQISETLGLPLNTVKVYLHRGRRQLRDVLRKRMPHEHTASFK